MPLGLPTTDAEPEPSKETMTLYDTAGGDMEFSCPGVPPGDTLVCHPRPSASRSMVCFVALFPAGQPGDDASKRSETPHEASINARSSPVLRRSPEYVFCATFPFTNVVLARARSNSPFAGISSPALKRIFIFPDAFKISQPDRSISLPESFFISIHSPLLALGEPIHAISLKIIFLESADDIDDEPADAEGKENEHEEAASGGEGTAVGTATVSSKFSSSEKSAEGGVAVETVDGSWISNGATAPGSEEALPSLSPIIDEWPTIALFVSPDETSFGNTAASCTLVAFSLVKSGEASLTTISSCLFCPPPRWETSSHVWATAPRVLSKKFSAAVGKRLYHKNTAADDPKRRTAPHKIFR